MKALSLVLLFCGLFSISYAQVRRDSLAHKLAFVSDRLDIDSIQQNLQPLPDTLLPSFHTIDSIRNDFNLAVDTIQSEYEGAVSKIDAQARKLNQTIDSLQRLDLPTNRYTHRLDSLDNLRRGIESNSAPDLMTLNRKPPES